MGQYFGKYRGTVINNVDPEMRGRLMLMVPDVSSVIPTTWAEPCVPLAGPTGPPMGVYMVPPIGAGVWVEYEHGDSDYPIWVGCRWGMASDVPLWAHIPPTVPPAISPNIVIQSQGQNAIVISDSPLPIGGIELKSKSGASIIVNDTGIYIKDGKGGSITFIGGVISILGNSVTVDGNPVIINKGALAVIP